MEGLQERARRTPIAQTLRAFVLAAWAASCGTTQLPETTASEITFDSRHAHEATTLGPNDLVRVGVYGHPELSTPLIGNSVGTRVDPQGFLHLPLIAPVRVTGLTAMEARDRIASALAEFVIDPRVDVSVLEWAARRFYVFGEVVKPGAFVLDRPLTVYQGLSQSGPFTPRANREEVVLLRGTPEDLEVHVIDAEEPELAGLLALRADDVLFVRRTGAGRFADEILPILTGISSSLSSVATVLLIEDRLTD